MNTGSNITVSVIRSGEFPRSVSLPAGSTLADLSRNVGMDAPDRLVAMGEDGRAINASDRLYHGQSIAYSMKVAGAYTG